MSTFELKEHLKSKIDKTNDDTILSLITLILENEKESILSLSDAQKISIKNLK